MAIILTTILVACLQVRSLQFIWILGTCKWNWQVSNLQMSCRDWTTWPDTSGTFYQHGLTVISAWISNHIHYNVWDEITYPFPNFNGCTVEVWEWISNFIPHIGHGLLIHVWIIAVEQCALLHGNPTNLCVKPLQNFINPDFVMKFCIDILIPKWLVRLTLLGLKSEFLVK